jgi:hypothetical protein
MTASILRSLMAKQSGEWSMCCFGFSQGMDFIQRVISRPVSAEPVWVNQLMTGYWETLAKDSPQPVEPRGLV